MNATQTVTTAPFGESTFASEESIMTTAFTGLGKCHVLQLEAVFLMEEYIFVDSNSIKYSYNQSLKE